MPSIRGILGPYRFFFYSFDCVEPMHVHVERDEATCKFWLQPLSLAGEYRVPAQGAQSDPRSHSRAFGGHDPCLEPTLRFSLNR